MQEMAAVEFTPPGATPVRLTLARLVCWFLPPPGAGVVQRVLYPTDRGRQRGGRFVRRSPTGSRFKGSLADYHAFSSGVRGYSEWRLLAIAVALLQPGDLIVEVGANVGTETIGYSDIVGPRGRVVAFEPNPENVVQLNDALGLARQENVEIEPVALGEQAGRAQFAMPAAGASAGTGHLLLGPAEGAGSATYYGQRIDARILDVDCRRLDDYANALADVAMMAIDAEGAEISIIKGGDRLLERDRPAIAIEASAPHLARAGHSIATLFDELRSRRYRVYEIHRTGRLRELHRPPAEEGSRNWLCLHQSTAGKLAARVQRTLVLAALTPMIPGLNPLTRPRVRMRGRRGRRA